MNTQSYRHRPRFLSRSLSWLVALALLIQPLLIQFGELHGALAHGESPETVHTLSADAHLDGHETRTDHGVMHVLLHIAHCCGHVSALPGISALHWVIPVSGKERIPPTAFLLPAPRLATLLRPPISA